MLRGAIGNPTSNPAVMVQLSQEFDNGVFRGDVSFTSTRDGSTRYYWLDLPDDFENSTSTPLAIFFHGYTGDRYDYSNETRYQSLRQAFQTNNWIVAAVDCRKINSYDTWYNEISRQDINDVVNDIRSKYNINLHHIHTLGTSMGGAGALQYAMFNNEEIASAIDIMGISNFTQFYNENPFYRDSLEAAFGGNPTQVPAVYENESALGNEQRFSNLPIMMLHGTDDTVVSVNHSRNLNQSLSTLGSTVNFVEVAGVGHDDESLINGREMEILNWLSTHPSVKYSLTIDIIGNGYVILDPDKTLYAPGTNVSLTAVPTVGWNFSDWSGDVSSTETPTVVTMDGDLSVVATFTQLEYDLSVSVVGSGSVSLNNSGPYYFGDVVELTAIAEDGWEFSDWSGDVSSTETPTVVTMDGDLSVVATFTELPEPTPSPTPEPTPSPTPSATPSPTPEPTPSPSPEPAGLPVEALIVIGVVVVVIVAVVAWLLLRRRP